MERVNDASLLVGRLLMVQGTMGFEHVAQLHSAWLHYVIATGSF
jgi:hypothetical protein